MRSGPRLPCRRNHPDRPGGRVIGNALSRRHAGNRCQQTCPNQFLEIFRPPALGDLELLERLLDLRQGDDVFRTTLPLTLGREVVERRHGRIAGRLGARPGLGRIPAAAHQEERHEDAGNKPAAGKTRGRATWRGWGRVGRHGDVGDVTTGFPNWSSVGVFDPTRFTTT